jgi:CRISPR-associated protein Csm1
MEKRDDKYVCALAADQVRVGKRLGHSSRVLVTCENPDHRTLSLDLFGYFISFTGDADRTGKFGPMAKSGQLRRAWDFSQPPKEKNQPLFCGYARREINAYVPLFGEQNAWEFRRYQGLDEEGEWDDRAPKTFAHIARDDLRLDEGDRRGTDALMVLKGDVDNLGSIFEKGLEKPSFAKWASLSRQMNAFFAIYLPWLCKERYPSTYTVFAGGDDFFLIGPWRSTVELAREMREAFGRYVAGNPEIHFSSGLIMASPGIPVRQLGDLSEAALEEAKAQEGKNAVSVFGETVSWKEFGALWRTFEEIDRIGEEYSLSTGYLYRLQELAQMSENLKSKEAKPENAIWRSWFGYRTWRMLERMRGVNDAERRRRMGELAKFLSEPIEQFGSRFRIPLFIHLYQHRH